jgi:hypothetical protein
MRKYLTAAAAAALMITAAGITYAQTPPSTDRPKGTSAQTSASPKMERGGMKGVTRKATKSKKATKVRTAKRTKRAPAQKAPQQDDWWRWGDDKKGKR